MTFQNKAADFDAFNIKEDEDQDAMALVTKALDNLKASASERDTKQAEREAKLIERLDKMEAKMNRPGGAPDTKGQTLEQKAFSTYLRTGQLIGNAIDIEGKTLVVGTPASAGYLATPEYSAEIIKLLTEKSPIRQYANVKPISSAQLIIPRRVSSVTVATVAEGAAITPSTPTFEQLTFAPIKNAAAATATNEMLQDSAYDLEAFLRDEFTEQFAAFEGIGFINGTSGTNGLLKAGAITNEVKTGVAADLPATDAAIVTMLVNIYGSIPSLHAQNGVWVMNRTILNRLRQIKDTTGVLYLAPNLANGPSWSILGRPVVEAKDVPNVGAGNNVMVFGDLKGFMVVDRIGLGIIRDEISMSLNWLTNFVGVQRVASGITHPDRFVRVKCAV